MIIPSGTVRVLVAVRPVDFRRYAEPIIMHSPRQHAPAAAVFSLFSLGITGLALDRVQHAARAAALTCFARTYSKPERLMAWARALRKSSGALLPLYIGTSDVERLIATCDLTLTSATAERSARHDRAPADTGLAH
jgi:hypothetical protein